MSEISRKEFDELKAVVNKLSTTSTSTSKPKKHREPTEYNKFIAEEYKKIKEKNPSLARIEIFKEAVKNWSENKVNKEKEKKSP